MDNLSFSHRASQGEVCLLYLFDDRSDLCWLELKALNLRIVVLSLSTLSIRQNITGVIRENTRLFISRQDLLLSFPIF